MEPAVALKSSLEAAYGLQPFSSLCFAHLKAQAWAAVVLVILKHKVLKLGLKCCILSSFMIKQNSCQQNHSSTPSYTNEYNQEHI